jgi:signal transduction histidine kinase
LLRTLGFAYYYKGEKERGFTTLLAALELSKSAKNTMRELHILSDLAEVYESDNAPLAINYYNQALRIADRYKMPSRQAFILNELSLLYKKKGDYKTALSLKEESSKLKGEFYESSTAKRIDDLESAYDLERSKSEIAALTIAKSEQETSKTIWLVVSVLVSVVGLVVLVFSYRSHRLNTLLQQSNTQLAESNLVKDKLFSIVAHDIRSPLISLIGMLELLREKEIDSKDYDYSVLKLIENSENSLQVIDQLLKWGENQIKGVRINKITFNPVDSVNRVVQFLNNIAAKKEIRIDFVPTDIGNIEADRDHFEFVMRNLLANAIKFSHTGGIITISAHRTAENQLIFEVADKGIGIAPDRLNNLFELSSASTSGTASELGTGLGLVLCKEFVEANGGRISVWSELGKGTLFTSSFNLALDDMA